MANDTDGKGPQSSTRDSSQSSEITPSPPTAPPASAPDGSASLSSPAAPVSGPNKQELLDKARAFLTSPQAQYQDAAAKRKFLTDKGLCLDEVDNLLRTTTSQQTLVIPPRTYPQPPPSNLPNLLLGLTRVFSWLTGGSLALAYIYYRFLLPRIIQTSTARASLRTHHLTALRQLTSSLSALKEAQSENYAALPRPQPHKEPESFAIYSSVAEVLKHVEEKHLETEDIPHISLLRCAIEDFGNGRTEDDAKPTTEELFRYLEGKIPWFTTDEGIGYEEQLWQVLSTCPLFTATPASKAPVEPGDDGSPRMSRWSYNLPLLPEPSPVVKSLKGLSSEMPRSTPVNDRPFQRTLQVLSDFTGYLSTQVYLPYRPSNVFSSKKDDTPATPEEQLKQEIRGLKGLILNRRTFFPTTQRQPGEIVQHPTT